MPPTSDQPAARPEDQPEDLEAVIDLLGALAYGELSAFDHLADDAGLAPNLAARAHMSAMAAREFGHYEQIAGRLQDLGAAPADAMAPFVAALESYHSITQPSTWLESVAKAYVGDGMAADFYREVAAFVDEHTASLIREVVDDGDRAEFAVGEVRAAIEAAGADGQTSVAGRLALWTRRLVGEAISQTQHVLADRDSLTRLLMTGAGDLSGVAGLLTRITDRHTERMTALGLDS